MTGAYTTVTGWLGSNQINVNSTGALAISGTSNETINMGAYANLSLGAAAPGATYSGVLTPSGSTFNLGGGGGPLTVASNLIGSGKSLSIAGDVVLVGANNYGGSTAIMAATNTGGSTAISAGTLQVGNGGTTGSLPSGSVITDNGTLVFDLGSAVTQGTNFSGAGITGSGSLTQAGSGSLVLNAANAYSGGTTITAGTLSHFWYYHWL